MLERSSVAENALQALHDEDYDRPFNLQNLNHATMVFILYGFDRKGRFGPRRFVVTPNGSPWFNGEALYTDVLAFVARFMENGRDDVWPTDWEGRRGLYLFEDRKPDDFDAQLQRVLAHIDREGVNAQADALATQWGFSA